MVRVVVRGVAWRDGGGTTRPVGAVARCITVSDALVTSQTRGRHCAAPAMQRNMSQATNFMSRAMSSILLAMLLIMMPIIVKHVAANTPITHKLNLTLFRETGQLSFAPESFQDSHNVHGRDSSNPKNDIKATIANDTEYLSGSIVILDFTCEPYVNVNYSVSTITTINNSSKLIPLNTNDFCDLALYSMKANLKAFLKHIYFAIPVRVKVKIYPFCTSNDCDTRVLGTASPVSFIDFTGLSSENASATGIDTNYLYPSSLAKQYYPSLYNSSEADIQSYFNANARWYFPNAEYPNEGPDSRVWDASNNLFHGGLMYATTSTYVSSGTTTTTVIATATESVGGLLNVFDFAQTFTHEVVHGLGFLTSWSSSSSQKLTVPGNLLRTDGHTSVQNAFIFDKYLVDAKEGVWLEEISSTLRDTINSMLPSDDISEPYASLEQDSEARNISSYLYDVVTSTGRLATYFPCKAAGFDSYGYLDAVNPNTEHAISLEEVIMYTPPEFQGSSSISHVDPTHYAGTTDFLMRPFGMGGVPLYDLPASPYAPFGRKALGILRAMGYVVNLESY